MTTRAVAVATARAAAAGAAGRSAAAAPGPSAGEAAPGPGTGHAAAGAASVVAQVLRETERGLTADRIAARLGVPDDVVELALEHAERLGLVVRSAGGSPCRTGCPTGPDTPLGCHGCPFAR